MHTLKKRMISPILVVFSSLFLSWCQSERQDSPSLPLRLRGQKTGETYGQAPRGARSPQAVQPRRKRAGQGELRRRQVLLGGGGRGEDRVESGCCQTVHKPKGEVLCLPCKRFLDFKPEGWRPVRCQHLPCHAAGCGAEAQEGGRVSGLRRGPRVLLLRGIWSTHSHLRRYLHWPASSIFQSRSPTWRQKQCSPNHLFYFLQHLSIHVVILIFISIRYE